MTKIKIIAGVGALLLAGLAAWYVQGLRADNARLTDDNARLVAVNAANVSVIEGLKVQHQQNKQLMQQWVDDQEQTKKLLASLNQQIQKELKSNEKFKVWTTDTYNIDAYRLRQSARSGRISNN